VVKRLRHANEKKKKKGNSGVISGNNFKALEE
jgi:hypothetical protein